VVYVTHDQTEALSLADRIVVLDKGQVQQVASPEDVYRRPANRFVASFIGSPSMNLFETVVEHGSIRIGDDRLKVLSPLSGPVVAGIRPDAVVLGTGGRARILWTEILGSQILCGLQCGSVLLTALTAQLPAPDNIAINVNPNDIHLFDAHTGKNLDCSSSGAALRA
jgi:ABC-type sugar transport system ATPase subunit